MREINLGQTVKDTVSGFTGIVHSRTEFLTGNVQLSLQPPVKDGTLPDLQVFDIHQLTAVPKKTDLPFIPAPFTGVVLGEEYRDIVTGFAGVAVRRVTFLNGCVYYVLMGSFDPKSGKTTEDFIEWKRLERVGAGVRAKMDKKVQSPVAEPPGGPAFRNAARG